MPRDVISIDYTSFMQGFINGKYAMVTFIAGTDVFASE